MPVRIKENYVSAIGATCVVGAALLTLATASANEALADLAGRIEYAFYAGDVPALSQSVQALQDLAVDADEQELRAGYLNYGRWKLAQRLSLTDTAHAEQAAEACAASTTAAKAGELLALHEALQAACLGMLEQLRPLRRAWYRGSRDAVLEQAHQAGGKLAEVQLVEAWFALRMNAAQSAFTALSHAVDAYAAAELAPHADVPHWGYAEACYGLGRAELARGHALAARNLFERALVLAPDYRDAQTALQALNVK